jgi:hypothetical protein
MLPLNHHGQANAHVLARWYLAGRSLAGTHTLFDLNVVTHRYLGPAAAVKIRPLAGIMTRGRQPAGFVLYDGGRRRAAFIPIWRRNLWNSPPWALMMAGRGL